MPVISRRAFRPLPGKTALALGRVKRLGECLTRFGGRVRISTVAWGDGARDIHLYGVFETMQAGAKAFAALTEDAEGQKLRAESENDPGSAWDGPEVWRTVYGELRPDHSVMLQREYSMDRRNLRRALDLLPEVQALDKETPVIGVVPVISSDMSRLMVGYYAKSLVQLGETMDRVGMSEAFQAIVVRGAELGTLTKARVIMTL